MEICKMIASNGKCFFKITSVIVIIILLSYPGYSQKGTVINIESANNAIALQADTGNRLGVIYFGKKLKNAAEYKSIPAMTKRESRC